MSSIESSNFSAQWTATHWVFSLFLDQSLLTLMVYKSNPEPVCGDNLHLLIFCTYFLLSVEAFFCFSDLCQGNMYVLSNTWFWLDVIATGRVHVTYHGWFKMAFPCVSLSVEEEVSSNCCTLLDAVNKKIWVLLWANCQFFSMFSSALAPHGGEDVHGFL